jgi:CheY-like chemotaxis protein
MAVSLRVFVVDDCRDTADALRMLIKLWGHEVHVANDGATALEQAPQVKPDVVFLDLSMPAIDGATVARQMRQLAPTKSCRLIALTGWADAAHRQQAVDAGFDDYLVKPIAAERLRDLLEETENGRQTIN